MLTGCHVNNKQLKIVLKQIIKICRKFLTSMYLKRKENQQLVVSNPCLRTQAKISQRFS